MLLLGSAGFSLFWRWTPEDADAGHAQRSRVRAGRPAPDISRGRGDPDLRQVLREPRKRAVSAIRARAAGA